VLRRAAEATGWISMNHSVRLYHRAQPSQQCADPANPCLFNLKTDPLVRKRCQLHDGVPLPCDACGTSEQCTDSERVLRSRPT
jgi:hypothetical protein